MKKKCRFEDPFPSFLRPSPSFKKTPLVISQPRMKTPFPDPSPVPISSVVQERPECREGPSMGGREQGSQDPTPTGKATALWARGGPGLVWTHEHPRQPGLEPGAQHPSSPSREQEGLGTRAHLVKRPLRVAHLQQKWIIFLSDGFLCLVISLSAASVAQLGVWQA